MYKYTTDCYEIKRVLLNLLKKYEGDNVLSFKSRKTLVDLMYGVMKSSSLQLSSIARALNEDVKLSSTITRLDRNINSHDFDVDLFSDSYVNFAKSLLDDEMVVIVDDTEIAKPYSKKLEDLDRIRDASQPKTTIVNGYNVCEMVALSAKSSHPVTIASKIFSTKSKDFKSKNVVYFDLIKEVVKNYGTNITFVFDRGFDNKRLIELLDEIGVKYVIRALKSRNYYKNEVKISTKELISNTSVTSNVVFENDAIKCDLQLSDEKVKISDVNKDVRSVIVQGFGEDAMILLTNDFTIDIEKIFWIYISRWKVEEMFRYNKNIYGYEKMMVREIRVMQKMINVLHLINMIQLTIYENDRSRLKDKVISRSKSLRKNVKFYMYQMSKGIAEILSRSNKSIDGLLKRRKREVFRQLTLF